jgi:hypothetical protein
MNADGRIFDHSRAVHLIESRLLEEHCILCGAWAAHIVAEQVSVRLLSRRASGLCCEHFRWVIGDCATHVYGVPALTVFPREHRWVGRRCRR